MSDRVIFDSPFSSSYPPFSVSHNFIKPMDFSYNFSHSVSGFYVGVEFRKFDAIFISCNVLDDVLRVGEIQTTFMCDCCNEIFVVFEELEYLYFAEMRNSYVFERSTHSFDCISLKSLIHYKSYDLIQCQNVFYLLREIDFFSIYGSN